MITIRRSKPEIANILKPISEPDGLICVLEGQFVVWPNEAIHCLHKPVLTSVYPHCDVLEVAEPGFKHLAPDEQTAVHGPSLVRDVAFVESLFAPSGIP